MNSWLVSLQKKIPLIPPLSEIVPMNSTLATIHKGISPPWCPIYTIAYIHAGHMKVTRATLAMLQNSCYRCHLPKGQSTNCSHSTNVQSHEKYYYFFRRCKMARFVQIMRLGINWTFSSFIEWINGQYVCGEAVRIDIPAGGCARFHASVPISMGNWTKIIGSVSYGLKVKAADPS